MKLHSLKISLLLLLILLTFSSFAQKKNVDRNKIFQTEFDWADLLNQYVTKEFMPAEKYVWNWNEAIYLKSVAERYDNNFKKKESLKYLEKAVDITFGNATGLHPNAVASGFSLAFLARVTGEEKYRKKAFEIYEQYLNIPRASNGGVSHRDNVIELWDDTVYMVDIFLLEMYKLTGDIKYLKEAIFQYNAHAEKLRDEATGLWYHGWDNDSISTIDPCCLIGWADNQHRRNTEFWGRGNGWITMILADILTVMPQDMDGYEVLRNDFVKMMTTLAPLQNKENGHWYQLPIYSGENGNFIESSCTAMFAYSMTLGIKNRILPTETFQSAVDKAYKGIREHSLQWKNGYLTMANVCTGTCLGDKAYYYEREIVSDRAYAFGIAIMFYDQYNKLK